ncbi:MraY family glycosyltransferase [Flavobacterium oreochromis]|uniref:MraY family glycosyltransferase n=1 Tax=Flavobacterium oreochromis TaxID=2906078 RepID=UPI00385CD0C0
MEYIFIFFGLFVLINIYIKIADTYNIIDKPNHRSAHTEITIRGGGIIFWFSAIIISVQYFQELKWFLLGITLMSLVSFWDDIQSLPNKIRLIVHFTAITLAFYSLGLFSIFPIYLIIIAYFLFVGIINAYNFMDGINGITGLYTLVFFSAMYWVNQNELIFTISDFLLYPMIASLVFLFYNYRGKAKCFAGDIGSISIAFWIVYTLVLLMLKTKSFVWMLFLSVYGVDTVVTIMHRLYLKENIFEAHRHHFYQVLCNEMKISHKKVSLVYAVVQLLIDMIVIRYEKQINDVMMFFMILLPLILLYTYKFSLIKKLNLR